ncbi:hypothetical protein [Halobacillus salinus]|uniref:hypothetical protein n=1 Tax=Halobacillus salinus TaxID=192814 RepID=UPI001305239E|nr:hypothetical protein [Halobacillus salinus]
MSNSYESTEERMKNQRRSREREKQYNILTSLGWKSAGALFLLLVAAIVVYAFFIR